MGGKNYSMRIWLDPNKLAAYGLNPTDVTTAINEQSREAAAGSIGQNSGSSFEYIIKYVGKYNSKEQYDNIIIKSLGNGQNLMLKDVAKVELAAQSYTGRGKTEILQPSVWGFFKRRVLMHKTSSTISKLT